ncbi:chromosome segregation protein SMC [Mechercharimyces sp. CAU 1602]|uniref:chromosome segregation protein SMC n=1 Tax=Mechercharimyces sp. CAU 1602 TaxID=2973933 RepID=UPI002162CBF0|nr:chromosome segregation protein SMC [Mechercharimyces sp. CAU 1602]MCS1351360.1 chromosome segregation protein SMC [Mechercharimyces sp. CAU 1602]
MYLKRLEMIGFKSFADRTEMTFTNGVSGVVGPNGSGKSNVTDAIRWVLGEQSAKSLRGVKMEDVIFAGSDTRKPVGYCEVGLTLDNTDQSLPLDYDEVRISRRVYRSGESHYYINNQTCRLKDLTELFMDTGIGKEAYSMIGQGRIDDILSTKSEDRRAIFEEAAGIVKYKTRKREAEKKLEATEQNLERLYDLIIEIRDQIEPLVEQAESAKKYKAYKEQLTKVEIGLYVHKIDQLHAEWNQSLKGMEKLKDDYARFAAEVRGQEAELESFVLTLTEQEQKVEALQARLLEVSEEVEKAEGQKDVLAERIQARKTWIEESFERERQLLETDGRLAIEIDSLTGRKGEEEKKQIEIADEVRSCEERLQMTGENAAGYLEAQQERWQELGNQLAGVVSENSMLAQQREQLLATQKRVQQDQEEVSKELTQAQRRLQELYSEKTNMEHLQQNVISQVEEHTREWQRHVEQFHDLEREVKVAEQEHHKVRSRFDLNKELEAEHAGFFQGVKMLLKARDRGEERLQAVHGAVAQLIRVPEKVEAAMEIALGGAMQHLVVTDEAAGRNGIEWLKRQRAGRATFLPLDVIRARALSAQELERVRHHEGFIGIAADLIETEPQYQSLVSYLLGHVIVARQLEEAHRLASILRYRYRIVTLEGEVVNPGGSMSGGSRAQAKNALLSRAREIEKLEEAVVACERREKELREQLERLDEKGRIHQQRLHQCETEKEQLRQRQQELYVQVREQEMACRTLTEKVDHMGSEERTLDTRIDKLVAQHEQNEERAHKVEEERAELSARIRLAQTSAQEQASAREETVQALTEWKVKAAHVEQSLAHLLSNLERAEEEQGRIRAQLHTVLTQRREAEVELSQSQQEMEEWGKLAFGSRKGKEEVAQALEEGKRERNRMQSERKMREEVVRRQSKELRQQEEALSKEEIRATRLDVELNHLLEKLAEEYELSFELARQRYPVPEQAEQAERGVRSLKTKIQALGDVNIGAIEEHQRLSERLFFLESQRDDLMEAKQKLYEVIQRMEDEMSTRFIENFEAIRAHFGDVFVKMFGGGRADLVLTEPENLLTTGIEIMAQPPGKKLQNLALLSGGERALTAIALLFAVLCIKPVPFCVLDEVDAALDEANLTRFTRYLKEFSQETQFIIITHRKRTMEGADVLYGITMQESGVSTPVSIRLEDYDEKREVAATHM